MWKRNGWVTGSVNHIFLENVVFEMESEAEEVTGAELGKGKGSLSLIRQVCPECLCAGHEFDTGLVRRERQLRLAETLVMGYKAEGVD